MQKQKNNHSFQEVLSKMMRYCAYQERSEKEVNDKLKEYLSSSDEIDEILDVLIAEKFIDNERFAIAFANGKLKVKAWGKYKIIEGLRMKGISSPLIQKAIDNLDCEIYEDNLRKQLEKKADRLTEGKDKSAKIYRYLLAKGYESDLILREMNERKLMQ